MPIINLRDGWIIPNPPDPMPDDEFARRTLILRQSGLMGSDYRMLPDAGTTNIEEWEAYRAALRDGPAILATRNGDEVTIPDPPT
jgi:hypothetical protein